MVKYIKFTVSEDRMTYLKNSVGFEHIDEYINRAIDEMERRNGLNR